MYLLIGFNVSITDTKACKIYNAVFSISDTAAYPISKFQEFKWEKHFGKPISLLLKDLNRRLPGYISSKIFPGHLLRAHAIHLYYANNVVVVLGVFNFNHMNPSARFTKWDKSLFIKENNERLEVWADSSCLYNNTIE